MRKKILGLGLIIGLIGLVVLAFPVPQGSDAAESFFVWNPARKTLQPSDRTFAVQLMRPGEWFRLNVSSTDLVELRASLVMSGGEEKRSIFAETGTTFGQTIQITLTGSYEVAISNISPSVVTLSGNVAAQRAQASAQILTPYGFLGFILMIVGAAVSIYGALGKPKRRLKSKRARVVSGKRTET